MSVATSHQTDFIENADHIRNSMKRANRNNRLRAFGLVLPLLLFILFAFILPIGDMLFRSVQDDDISTYLLKTAHALQGWQATSLPDEAIFALLAEDVAKAKKDRTLGKVGARLNYEKPGMRGLMNGTGRKIKNAKAPYKEFFIKANKKWGDIETWQLIKTHSGNYSLSYFLAALDMQYNPDGSIGSQPELEKVYVDLFVKTIIISMAITFICILLGYPIAFLMATLPVRISNLLLILVLLPFWTSLLVRTTSWIVLLQSQGVLNDIFVFLGITGDEARFSLIYNMTGTIVAMVHILLPFMVLPLFSVMKTIPPTYMRAARSLGGKPFTSFRRVYFPQTIPGIGAGSILVFILAMGYYITPALVGGRTGQLISNFIAYHMQKSLNWGLAAALGSILLFVVVIMYFVYNRVIGIDKMKLG